MMKELLLLLFSLLLCVPAFAADEKTGAAKTQSTVSAAAPFRTVTAPVIMDRPVRLTEYRKQLTREYAFQHYGEEFTEIVPQVVVVHWTELPEADGVYEYFYKEARADGTLNVCSQFLVDRDGTIFRLTPETMLDRHAIGYNWCAIGIENVGGVDKKEDLTPSNCRRISCSSVTCRKSIPRFVTCGVITSRRWRRKAGCIKNKYRATFTGRWTPARSS